MIFSVKISSSTPWEELTQWFNDNWEQLPTSLNGFYRYHYDVKTNAFDYIEQNRRKDLWMLYSDLQDLTEWNVPLKKKY